MTTMKKIWLIALCVFLTLSLKAAPVDRNVAMKMASAFLKTNDLQLVNLSGRYGLYNLYAVSGENCFVLLSADDSAFPLLAYSFENPFSLDISENTLYWIRSYDQEIQSLKDRGIEATEEVRKAWSDLERGTAGPELNRSEVKPLIFSQWGQYTPYNLYCPGGCVTGCVATAMAQIMRYWEYPNHGTGYYSYSHPTYGLLSASFGSTTYDWDNMPRGATSDSPSAVQQALGTLLYHCGVAVDMNYGTDGSGASADRVPNAMTSYFGYSSAISLIYKDNGYTDETWKSMLKTELDASRPLFYAGQDQAHAHAFVCDGYDSRDYFHFNWGWNCQDDGYYAIGALNPSLGWNYNLCNYVIKGIEPLPVSVSAPYNLLATVNGNDVQLRWNAASGASYYKVYRDGELIAGHVTGLTYTDTSVAFGRHGYFVRGVTSSGDRSRRSNVAEAVMAIQVSTPTGLFAFVGDNAVNLFWSNPVSELGHLLYMNYGHENDSYGYGGESPTYWAQRYPVSMISQYEGLGVDLVEGYFKYPGQYTAYLCKGNHAGITEMITQQTFTVTEEGTQSLYLEEPFLLDCSKDLWVVMSAPASIPYPVVYCNYNGAGLADACYISPDFSSWESMASDHVCWRLSVEVSDCPYIHKIYRNGMVIADDVHGYYYIDDNLSAGTQCYQLKAYFNGVESSLSEVCTITLVNVSVRVSGAGTVEGAGFYEDGQYATLKAIPNPGESFLGWKENGVTVNNNLEYTFYAYESRQLEACFTGVGVEENAELGLEVYPNPVKDVVRIEAAQPIQQVTLLGINGVLLEDRKTNARNVELNLEGYSKGIYVVRIVTEDGVATQKINLIE